ncbi:putative quinol monooxygenase [Sphingomonas morindae]|uniref:Antibiotic biosynthesis monooxygenase n=1 Tax=Sphingomonas morindae TaxID=1541170 RepID=A0ABY4X9W9_9SPHN|nr:putative quinol monooxygenase [Sphingomonas morindae]USI73767.1 antibiotic biosynthesis monooxygenase [Sphingomonas morindae]
MSSQPSADPLDLVATLVARPGQEDALADALRAIIPAVREEPGCLAYSMYVDRDDPRRIVMIERWADRAALDAHEAAPPFLSLAARFDTLLDGAPTVTFLRHLA